MRDLTERDRQRVHGEQPDEHHPAVPDTTLGKTPAQQEEDGETEERGRGRSESLDQSTAEGLAAWINTAVANQLMALRLGSTQINAADLESLPIPTTLQLDDLRSEAAAGRHEATDAKYIWGAMTHQEMIAVRTTETMRKVRRKLTPRAWR